MVDVLAGTGVPRLLSGRSRRSAPEQRGTVRRRRAGVSATLVVGAVLLALALRVTPGDAAFYPLTLALAGSWLTGGLVSGPLHLGGNDDEQHRVWLAPALLAVGLFAVFAVAAWVVREVSALGALHDAVLSVIERADIGSRPFILLVALVNGAAEEVFFRGSVYTALGDDRPVLWSTVAYVVVTAATLNVALIAAAAVMGLIFALERRSTGGILAPMLTHVVWSVLMIFFLPR